jgi:electron transfer flavoprotein alpha subunit
MIAALCRDGSNLTAVLAVIPVRDGVVPAGGAETADECGGRSLVIGSGTVEAAPAIGGIVSIAEVGTYRPAAWAEALAPVLAAEAIIVLPTSPDGRDLGPRLAAALGRPFFAGAISVNSAQVVVARGGGLSMHTIAAPAAFVATLQVGVRGVIHHRDPAQVTELPLALGDTTAIADAPHANDARLERLVDPDPASIDLSEAQRIVGGGAGLNSTAQFDLLTEVGVHIGASVGATRVITDRGWVPHERQIGTTGVVVDPQLYLAFGISGAVQHTSGLGQPDHIISVNTDAHCPMMQLADLAVVADANEVLTHLARLLGSEATGG